MSPRALSTVRFLTYDSHLLLIIQFLVVWYSEIRRKESEDEKKAAAQIENLSPDNLETVPMLKKADT